MTIDNQLKHISMDKESKVFQKEDSRSFKIPISTKLILGYLPIIVFTSAIFAIVGIRLISDRILLEAQEKVRHDLNSAAEIYQSQLNRVRDVIKLTSQRFFLSESIFDDDLPSVSSELIKVMDNEELDFLSLTNSQGEVVFRASNPEAPINTDIYDEIISAVLSQKKPVVSTAIVSSEALILESKDLAERAFIELVDTPHAKPRNDKFQSEGLVIKSAAPVLDEKGELIGVLYGGILLNNNFTIVDYIKQTVFEGVHYEGKDIGTATIFLDDVRISTNVLNDDSSRAIGTRVSEEVYNQVIIEAKPWIGRAYVVNDWYITAYEPIRDIHFNTIGILYVGILEQKYIDLKNQTIMIFGSIAIACIVVFSIISYFFSRMLSKPIYQLVDASREIANGNLNPNIQVSSNDELGELSSAFSIMSKTLAEREESLKEYTKSKIMESERLAIIGQLAANVAHELNNPLVGIITYSNLLLEDHDCNEEISTEYINKIVIQANRCKDIVRGLLDFSRQPKTDRTLVNINTLLNQCLSLLKCQAIFHNIKLILELNELPMCVIDPSQIERVFMNIILNAAEAMEGKGELRINTSFDSEENMVEINIADNGPGISEEHLEKVFDPFFTTKAVGHGVGLGLAISYGIVRDHNGSTSVKSKVDEGTTFTIRLPVSIHGEMRYR